MLSFLTSTLSRTSSRATLMLSPLCKQVWCSKMTGKKPRKHSTACTHTYAPSSGTSTLTGTLTLKTVEKTLREKTTLPIISRLINWRNMEFNKLKRLYPPVLPKSLILHNTSRTAARGGIALLLAFLFLLHLHLPFTGITLTEKIRSEGHGPRAGPVPSQPV